MGERAWESVWMRGGGESVWMRGCDMLESNRSELIKNKTTA